MLDTVGIKHFYQSLVCNDFKKHWRFLLDNGKKTWVFNAKGSKTLPNLSLFQRGNSLWHLTAQVSLPKMLFGHNARLPNQSEVLEGLKMISEYVEEKSGLPFDYEAASVYLIHYAKDICFDTESEVWKMVEKLSKRRIKPLRKNFYEDSTIYFTAKGKTRQIRIYPKLQEVLSRKYPSAEASKMAKAVLRFENSLLKKSSIDSLIKKYELSDNTPGSLLTENISDLVISEILKNLNFFELISGGKTNLDILKEHFPTRKAMNLCGFLQMVAENGEGFYKDESHGFSRDSYFRDVKDCRKAKLW